MAYAKINQLLEGSDQEQQNANIFATDGGTNAQPQSTSSGSSSSEPKTSTEGSIQGGSQQQAAAKRQVTDTSQNRPSRDIFRRNYDRQRAPSTLDDIENRIGTARQGLEAEADSYVSNQQSKAQETYTDKATEDTFESAIDGDEDASGYVQGLSGQAAQVEAFDPTTNVNVAGDLAAGVRAGAVDPVIKGFLRQENDPSYNESEAAFDTQLLRAQPEFGSRLRGVAGQQESLYDYYDELPGVQQSAAQELMKKAREDALGTAQDYYTGQAGSLLDAQAQELADFREAAAQQGLGVLGDVTHEDPYIQAQAREGAGLDAAGFYGVDQLTPQEFIDAQEAQRYNRILELLGDPGELPGGATPGALAGGGEFNQDAYQQAVMEAATGKASDLDARIAAISDPAQAAYDAWRKEAEYAAAGDQRVENKLSEYSAFSDAFNGIAGFDPNLYDLRPWEYGHISNPEAAFDMGIEDFMDAQQYQDILGLYGERMTGQTLGAQNEVVMPSFDEDRYYQDAFTKIHQALYPDQPVPVDPFADGTGDGGGYVIDDTPVIVEEDEDQQAPPSGGR